MADCGTWSAVVAHRRAGQQLDEACAAEARRYKADHRANSPLERSLDAWRAATARTATRQLVDRHRPEYERLLQQVRTDDPRPTEETP